MAEIWELDRDFDAFFTAWSKTELEPIIKNCEDNRESIGEGINQVEAHISTLKNLIEQAESKLLDYKANLSVTEKIIDSALLRIDNIENE